MTATRILLSPADLIELRDQRREAVPGRAVPVADLVFFTIEIFLAVGLGGRAFGKFIGWTVDTIVGA